MDDQQVSGLTKLTVNLTPNSYGAMREAAKTTGDTQTDTVNRALQLYAFVVKQQADGWEPAMRRTKSIKLWRWSIRLFSVIKVYRLE